MKTKRSAAESLAFAVGTDTADLTAKVTRCLRSLQKLPALVRSFFRAPEVAYAAVRTVA